MVIVDSPKVLLFLRTFMCAFLLMIGVHSTSAQVSLTTNQTDLRTVIQRIKTKTKYRFFYDDALGKQKVNAVSISNLPIDFVLSRLFENTGITYKIIDNIIYLKKEKAAIKYRYTNSTEPTYQQRKREEPVIPTLYTFNGKVQDVAGNPIIGATIMVKGSSKVRALSDLEGKFILKSEKPNPILVISCIGFDAIEKYIENSDHQLFVLKESSFELATVFVTALGISRSGTALNYNVKQMEGEELNKVKTTNFANALAGRMAGVSVNESAAGMGGAVRVVMRGPKSLAQSNQPLYVIDGIPINNRSNDDIKGGIYSSQPGAEGISDINLDDIESVSVLSGAAAAALYGSAAAQGAVMIKTKSGRVGKTSVEFSTSTQFLSSFVLPEFQNEYGNRTNEMKSWGTKNASGTGSYTPNDFFRTGVNFTNNATVMSGTEHNQVYLSLGSSTVRGIIPNNVFERYNLTFKNVFTALQDKLRLTFSFKFVRENDRNMLAQGQYFNPLTSVYLFPRGESFDAIKEFETYDAVRNINLQNWNYGDDLKMQNPYWVTNRMLKTTKRNRYLTDFGVKYHFTTWLALEGRLRWDEAVNKLEDKRYASTLDIFAHSPYGYYSYSKLNDRSFYADVMADVSKRWGDLSLVANVGTAFTNKSYDIAGFQGGLKAPSNIFTPNGIDYSRVSSDNRPIFDITRHAIHSVLGSVELGWQERVYLTMTGRNDWDSSLSNTAQQSFFYPSVGMSAILSKMLRLPKFVDFLKFRTSWASVGSAISPNISSSWRYEYIPSTGTYHTVTYKFPDNFYPERTNSWEVGMTAHLFKETMSMKFTLYQSDTKNQTFLRQITLGGAFNREYIQAGDVRNRGLELSVGYNKKWKNLRWETNMTYSTNDNQIVRLLDNPNETLRQGGLNGCEVILTQGGTMGDLYTFTDFKRDAQGNILVNADGQVMQMELSSPNLVGSVLPKAHLGLKNNFTWKRFELGMLITARLGGVCVSQTQAFMDSYGVSKKTARLRNNGGVTVGNQLVSTENFYTIVGGDTPIWGEYVYSASNVRIKELYLGYTFDKLIRGAKVSIALTARNLLMLYCKAPFDPEATPSTDIYYQGFDYFMQPSQRSLGFSINVKL
ncbi:SusC/RagA family TonB-linked outer membrane protein [Prevotella scopos JCM 17725]|uniref:TonB-linked outer membrane protein, SusC/RagA family n=1 Tax=Prevotella scopos JCM 17725 TaxID=1236518 RepID=A0AAX2F6L6_9BACT|nr:SusC/RagA family protein [Prevotella scopos JCM 17725]QUB44666.1 SusC/RagA family TonB-linked outer membrane protein [Prevotella scopos JCM 17725]SHG10946.1 TonB-linked outer membrane protein, SusC/RagA family [Prevotella scopos JCM 17725]